MTPQLIRRLRTWWHRTAPSPPGATRSTAPEEARPAPDDPVVHDVAQTHEEVAGYWTDERMRAAKPREQQLPLPEENERG